MILLDQTFCVFVTDTSIGELEDAFRSYTSRDDIAIVLINQHVS